MRRWGTDDLELAEAYGLKVIGRGVRTARVGQGLTQRQLGWRVGLNQSTISRLETGRLRTMWMLALARVMGTLRMSPEYLFPGEPAGRPDGYPGEQSYEPPPTPATGPGRCVRSPPTRFNSKGLEPDWANSRIRRDAASPRTQQPVVALRKDSC